MLNSRFIVIPLDSSAVATIEWNSVTEELYVTYRNGEQSYTHEDVTKEEFDLLTKFADENGGSWGRALYDWKNLRVERFELQDRLTFNTVVSQMHPKTRERWLEWLQSQVRQDTLVARAKKNS